MEAHSLKLANFNNPLHCERQISANPLQFLRGISNESIQSFHIDFKLPWDYVNNLEGKWKLTCIDLNLGVPEG